MTSSVLPAPRPLRVLADLIPGRLARDATLVTLYVASIALAAEVRVPLPFTPVPVTGQTFVVLLGAAALGAGRATTGALGYLALGLAGVPWFAASSGATVGYVVGFVLAAALVGSLARRGADRTLARAVVLMLLGNLVIYACGVPWLAVVADVSLTQAVGLGATPFVVGDLAKIAVASVLLPSAWRLVGSD